MAQDEGDAWPKSAQSSSSSHPRPEGPLTKAQTKFVNRISPERSEREKRQIVMNHHPQNDDLPETHGGVEPAVPVPLPDEAGYEAGAQDAGTLSEGMSGHYHGVAGRKIPVKVSKIEGPAGTHPSSTAHRVTATVTRTSHGYQRGEEINSSALHFGTSHVTKSGEAGAQDEIKPLPKEVQAKVSAAVKAGEFEKFQNPRPAGTSRSEPRVNAERFEQRRKSAGK
jgi:hypothetical protein